MDDDARSGVEKIICVGSVGSGDKSDESHIDRTVAANHDDGSFVGKICVGNGGDEQIGSEGMLDVGNDPSPSSTTQRRQRCNMLFVLTSLERPSRSHVRQVTYLHAYINRYIHTYTHA